MVLILAISDTGVTNNLLQKKSEQNKSGNAAKMPRKAKGNTANAFAAMPQQNKSGNAAKTFAAMPRKKNKKAAMPHSSGTLAL